MDDLTHLNAQGDIRMVDVTDKQATLRVASAEGKIFLQHRTLKKLKNDALPKGNVFTTAKIAGVLAAKKTSELVPLCHQLNLSHVDLEFKISNDHVRIISTVKTKEATGVEMEALTAVSVAALTIYDMCKSVDKTMTIGDIILKDKKGGKTDHAVQYRPSVGIITMSDSVASGERKDTSGAILKNGFEEADCTIAQQLVLPDGSEKLEPTIRSWIDSGVELIITTGGTGLGPRDLTIPVIVKLFDSRLRGIEQALHAFGRLKIATATLSRLVAGSIGNSIIICLPGSPGAAKDGLKVLVPTIFHAFHMIKGEGH